MKHLSFAIEDNVGNATYRRNLERFIHEVPEIRATFLPIALIGYDLWQLVPGIRGNLALAASARAASALHASHFLDGCDAALIHSQSIGLFALEFMRRVPTVISTDATPANFDRLPGYPQPLRSRQAEWIKRHWTSLTFRSAAVLLAWSDWVRDSFVNDYGVMPEKIRVIPPGLDVELWRPDPTQRIADGKVRILFTSGDFHRKGGDLLLRWLKSTKHRKHVEIHMVLKQKGVPDSPEVVQHYGMTANSPELIRLAQRCDLFVLPTRADCSPWALIEAQAVGLPGVATHVGAIHEILLDQQTGFLAPVETALQGGRRRPLVDESTLFAALDRLVEDRPLRERMGLAARARVLSLFNSRKNTPQLIELMRQLSG